ncbi:glycosyltransferase [Actinomadura miaoliensis]|uniref:Glycosyltransferase subfamily 4-like N-terminal domain-containing protein n=1 Tax=Actinomadura miaoliensis TaxID=430685 RepID=A0ABP7X6P7_9ACTN
MAEPRDVFIVCNNTDAVGGLQRWAHHLARLLAGRGHHVTLVGVTHAAERHDYEADGSYAVVTLHEQWRPPMMAWRPHSVRQRLNVAAYGRDLWRTRTLRQGAARLSELFAGASPGGVVIAAQVWAMEWVRAADTTGLKVIGMTHESYEATRQSSRYPRVRELFAHCDRLLALTAEDADAWARDGMTNVGHMPNPLHVTPRRLPSLDAPIVACVGRLSAEKGVDLLLEAWARVASRYPGWLLRVYGAGPEEDELRRQAASIPEIATSVEFRGVVSDVETAFAGSSIFVLPSRAEGFPMSVLEAMAYGLPTVAFDCAPGVRALLTDGQDGLLVPPGDTAALAAALGRLIRDDALRRAMGARARASVERYRPDAVLDRWERLFTLLHRTVPIVSEPIPETSFADQEFTGPWRRIRRSSTGVRAGDASEVDS